MEVLRTQLNPITISSSSQQSHLMNRLSAIYRVSSFSHSSTKFRVLCTATTNSALITSTPQVAIHERVLKSSKRSTGRPERTTKASSDAQLKADWLDSLTPPLKSEVLVSQSPDSLSNFVIGIDPDASGALAVLKTDDSGISAQVFDSPYVKILVGKRSRRRLDTKSIIELLQSLGAPIGTTAYLEQSRPFPGDGKLGWWSGGFSYGLWIGVLVASGFSVVPVPCLSWKNEFKLAGNGASKDHSREVASTLFPDLCSLLKRKKDHGRAEALLIAAYGKGIKLSCNNTLRMSTDSEVPSDSVAT